MLPFAVHCQPAISLLSPLTKLVEPAEWRHDFRLAFMNWIGGGRRRHLGGGHNSAIRKQKAYFAKARNKKRIRGQKKTPSHAGDWIQPLSADVPRHHEERPSKDRRLQDSRASALPALSDDYDQQPDINSHEFAGYKHQLLASNDWLGLTTSSLPARVEHVRHYTRATKNMREDEKLHVPQSFTPVHLGQNTVSDDTISVRVGTHALATSPVRSNRLRPHALPLQPQRTPVERQKTAKTTDIGPNWEESIDLDSLNPQCFGPQVWPRGPGRDQRVNCSSSSEMLFDNSEASEDPEHGIIFQKLVTDKLPASRLVSAPVSETIDQLHDNQVEYGRDEDESSLYCCSVRHGKGIWQDTRKVDIQGIRELHIPINNKHPSETVAPVAKRELSPEESWKRFIFGSLSPDHDDINRYMESPRPASVLKSDISLAAMVSSSSPRHHESDKEPTAEGIYLDALSMVVNPGRARTRDVNEIGDYSLASNDSESEL